MKKELIAPCGMNCGICLHYLRTVNKCLGCFTGRKVNNKPIKCRIKLCKKRDREYCYSCKEFPCNSIRNLDERYRNRYGMSEIENLEFIRDNGMESYLEKEEKKWVDSESTYCVHDKQRYC